MVFVGVCKFPGNFGNFGNYVMQNDVLIQTLTVRETLKFAADLKLNIS